MYHYLVRVYIRTRTQIFSSHSFIQWNKLTLDVSFPQILALGQITPCLSELFLEKHSGGGGGEYNVG